MMKATRRNKALRASVLVIAILGTTVAITETKAVCDLNCDILEVFVGEDAVTTYVVQRPAGASWTFCYNTFYSEDDLGIGQLGPDVEVWDYRRRIGSRDVICSPPQPQPPGSTARERLWRGMIRGSGTDLF